MPRLPSVTALARRRLRRVGLRRRARSRGDHCGRQRRLCVDVDVPPPATTAAAPPSVSWRSRRQVVDVIHGRPVANGRARSASCAPSVSRSSNSERSRCSSRRRRPGEARRSPRRAERRRARHRIARDRTGGRAADGAAPLVVAGARRGPARPLTAEKRRRRPSAPPRVPRAQVPAGLGLTAESAAMLAVGGENTGRTCATGSCRRGRTPSGCRAPQQPRRASSSSAAGSLRRRAPPPAHRRASAHPPPRRRASPRTALPPRGARALAWRMCGAGRSRSSTRPRRDARTDLASNAVGRA